MTPTEQNALTRELRALREFARGDVIRGVASFECMTGSCPVRTITVHFVEEPGTKPFQHCRCPRCQSELRYVGLERTR